jgi:hypothetical protein
MRLITLWYLTHAKRALMVKIIKIIFLTDYDRYQPYKATNEVSFKYSAYLVRYRPSKGMKIFG